MVMIARLRLVDVFGDTLTRDRVHSEFRKVSAYRGYIVSTGGAHSALESWGRA